MYPLIDLGVGFQCIGFAATIHEPLRTQLRYSTSTQRAVYCEFRACAAERLEQWRDESLRDAEYMSRLRRMRRFERGI